MTRLAGDTPPVLVVHGNNLIGLAMARGLGLGGLRVMVLAGKRGVAAPSRYVWKSAVMADLRELPDQVLSLVKEHGISHVFCSSENVIVRLNEERARIESQARLMCAPPELFELALSKEKTLAIAEAAGVPIPRSVLLQRVGDAKDRAPELRGPLVAKFLKGPLPEEGEAFDFKAKHFPSAGEVVRWGESLGRDLPAPLLLQEFVAGRGVGVELLIRDGEPLAAFQHIRLREYPASGGGSCYCQSVPLDPVLLDHSLRLLAAMKWDGVAMVEFRQNPATGEAALMEVNGRFWGSTPLAINAGMNFPLLWYLSVTGRPVEFAPPRIGLRCRALPGDTLWLRDALRAHDGRRLRSLLEYLAAFTPSTTYFNWRWDDPWPAIRKTLGRVLRI